jgi:putative colanic acid biosynthesis glycosyltransferase WcaI
MLHVAFFNRSFYPETAATGQFLTELAEHLVADYGCRVSVVTGAPTSHGNSRRWRLVTRERYRGVEVIRAHGTRFAKRRALGRISNYLTYFASACYAGLRLSRPDVVIALTDPPIIGLAAYGASRRFGARFVMAYKDIFPEVAALLEDFQSPSVNRVLEQVNRFLVRHADVSVALGETMRRRLIEGKGAEPARTLVIPDWEDCSTIVPGPKLNPFTMAHGLGDKFVVMHAGNLGLSQALEDVVDAAAALERFPEIEIVFVGDGVRKARLQQRVETLGVHNVRFLPFQKKEDLRLVFAAADVFVVSLKRGLAGYIVPSKLYGILAAGRPYVAAVEEESEVADITRRYECGLLAEPGDPGGIAESIRRLYSDRALATRLGVNARRAALEFDRPKQVRAYYELLTSLVAPSS